MQRRTFLLIILLTLCATLLASCDGEQAQETEEPLDTILPTPTAQEPTGEAPASVTEIPEAPTETREEPTEIAEEPTAPAPASGAVTSGQAYVDEIAVTMRQEPQEVVVTVVGNLADGCTFLDEIQTERQNDTFVVTISAQRDAEAVCTQALVPFEETFTLGAGDLAPGSYTVIVNGVEQTFDVRGADEGTQQPATPAPTVSVTPRTGTPGAEVQLTAIGLPPNEAVGIGVGPPESEYEIISQATTDAEGRLNVAVTLPTYAEVGETWLFVVEANDDAIISNPVTITDGDATGAANRANIYLIALEDDGASGQPVGCGDSLVPVEVDIGSTIAPLRATLEQLLAIDNEFYGQSGLYNALFRSDLAVQGIDIRNGTAVIHLTGDFSIGGTCDAPRVQAQLTETALQFSTVNDVEISINGTPLEELLSQR